MSSLPQVLPQEADVSARAVEAFLDRIACEGIEMHAFMVLRHGKVAAKGVWKPFSFDYTHMLFSLSKSFTSTAVGFAVQEGLLSVEDSVLSFFPDEAPANPSENLKRMKIKHLLSMSTGHRTEPPYPYEEGADWVGNFLRHPVEYEPGTHFLYNTPASNLLSHILTKVTGLREDEYLKPRLFEPLGITDYFWEASPSGLPHGGSGLHLHTEDLAKFGLFLLHRGEWEGRQLLSADWIANATSKHIDNEGTLDWRQGYGYQFWRCSPPNVYRGDGAFGQFCIVMPDQDALFIANSATDNLQAILCALWDTVYASFAEDHTAPDPSGVAALNEKIAALCQPCPDGAPSDPAAAAVSGRRYRLEDNPLGLTALTLTCGQTDSLRVETARGEYTLPIGHGGWREGRTCVPAGSASYLYPQYAETACAAAWKEGVYRLTVRYHHNTARDYMELAFTPDGITVHMQRRLFMMGGDYTIKGT